MIKWLRSLMVFWMHFYVITVCSSCFYSYCRINIGLRTAIYLVVTYATKGLFLTWLFYKTIYWTNKLALFGDWSQTTNESLSVHMYVHEIFTNVPSRCQKSLLPGVNAFYSYSYWVIRSTFIQRHFCDKNIEVRVDIIKWSWRNYILFMERCFTCFLFA